MTKIKCIVVEDEPLAAKVLIEYILQVPFLELQETFKNAMLASEYLHDNITDLIFLDIHLPKLKGINFLKTLINPPSIILTTAYHQYAVEGFDLNVTDYLLKPFSFERFILAVNKVKVSQKVMKITNEKEEKREFVFLNVQKKKVKILFNEILYIESQREYIKLVTTKKQLISKISTNEIESLLPVDSFKRIHRSFIISINMIESFTAENVEINGITLPIGREYKGILDNL